MNFWKIVFVLFLFVSCEDAQKSKQILIALDVKQKIENYISLNKDDSFPSISYGTTGKGNLVHGKLFPFHGDNFRYFDSWSYLAGHAFLNDKVKLSVIETYNQLKTELPGRLFCIMECGLKGGGQINGHRTHQNGLSIDFMSPLLKNGKPYYKLDSLGSGHYALEFSDAGKYLKDTSVVMDFDVIAQHVLDLDKNARKHGYKVSKVIIKLELKDELFASAHGKKLKKSGIYVVHNLPPRVNKQHDDHYHIDFEKLE